MSTHIAHGGKTTIITTEEKRTLIQEALLKLGGIPKNILVIPPDITRLHSNAGELTRILYELWDAANGTTFDILPAIGTHAPMTETQIADMYGDLPNATYHVHHWADRTFTTLVKCHPSLSVRYLAANLIIVFLGCQSPPRGKGL